MASREESLALHDGVTRPHDDLYAGHTNLRSFGSALPAHVLASLELRARGSRGGAACAPTPTAMPTPARTRVPTRAPTTGGRPAR